MTTPSAWGSHISIVRGEKPPNDLLWKFHQGRRIQFKYSPEIGTNGYRYWLPVECPEFAKLRAELDLTPKPNIPFHLTIGNDPWRKKSRSKFLKKKQKN